MFKVLYGYKMINKISNDTIKRLKAEQYIHNSFIIVKELLENSIDAKSTYVKILLETDSITVSDNGEGVSFTDMIKIGSFGYTSKEQMSMNILNNKIDDKYNTMGYRGQALSALVETCDVTIKSSNELSGIGYEKNLNFGENVYKVARDKGTTVKVSNLFKRCPVRKKHSLNTLKSQGLKVIEYIDSIRYLHPISIDVKISIRGFNKQTFFQGNTGTLREFCIEKHGEPILEDFNDNYTLLLFQPNKTIKSKEFVNKRVVNPYMSKFIYTQCKKHTNDIPVIIIEVNDDADMNMSADKMDVALRNKKYIESNIYSKLDVFYTTKVIKKYDNENVKLFKRVKVEDDLNNKEKEEIKVKNYENIIKSPLSLISQEISNKKEFSNKIEIIDEKPKREPNRKALGDITNINKKVSTSDVLRDYNKYLNYTNQIEMQKISNPYEDTEELGINKASVIDKEEYSEKTVEYKEVINKEDFLKMEVIGQFNSGFIICKLVKNNKVLLIAVDQHAADEIYNFERLIRDFSFQKQKLIIPIKLNLNEIEEVILHSHYEEFIKNGFIVDDNNILSQVPTYKGRAFDVDDFMDLIATIQYNKDKFKGSCYCSRYRKIMAGKACRGSIMIGKALKLNQMKNIVTNLSTLELPWNCPHGRPTFNIIKSYDV